MLGEVNWLGEFRDPAQERRYRDESLDYNNRINGVVCSVVLVAASLFIINDIGELGVNFQAIGSRVILIAVSITGLYLTFGIAGRQSTYFATYLMAISVAIGNTYIAMSRPTDYMLHLGIDVLILVGMYIIVPTVRMQMTFAAIHTMALITLHFNIKEPVYQMANVTVPLTLVLANFIGLGMSALFNRARHQIFAQYEAERSIRQELERAHSDVRALAELIPMCASCKKIRNDAGYWEQVETYMQAISGASVTHGLCPECVNMFYPDAADSTD